MVYAAALPLLGKPWNGRAVFFLSPLAGLCSEFVFCLAGVAFHFTPAYYPSSLRDLGCGTKEPQRGERMLGRRWSMAEPLPRKTTQTNPKNKNAPMLANLFIFAAKSIGH